MKDYQSATHKADRQRALRGFDFGFLGWTGYGFTNTSCEANTRTVIHWISAEVRYGEKGRVRGEKEDVKNN